MRFDTHTHTDRFSADSKLPVDVLLDRAAALGLAGVAATDHYEPDYPDPRYANLFDVGEYLAALREADRSAAGGPRLLRGVEFGWQDHLGPELDALAATGGFDVLISSVHMLERVDPYFTRTIYDPGRKAVYGAFLASMARMLRASRSFDVLGHYDYVSRYAPWPSKRMAYADAPDEFDEIFRLLVESGRALELNTRTGYRLLDEGVSDWLPDPAVLRRYRELGGELVALGSDAHQAETVGRCLPEYAAFLEGLGFPGIAVFFGRKAQVVPF